MAKYPPFKKPAPGFEIKKEIVMDLWEIFPDPVENSTPLGAFLNLDKMAVLLYLESYAKEGDLCTAIDCDNQGVEQVAKLRVLLVSSDDVKIIAKNDLLYTKYNLWAKTNALPRVAVKSVVLNAVNTARYASLKQAFVRAVADGTLLDGLTKGIESLALDFNQLLQLNFSVSAAQTIQNLKTVVQTEYPVGFQYKYDWLKDVVDTYNEIIELLLDLKEECMPDITAFPKHLLLGLISEIQNKNKQLRHQYYKSKAHRSGDYKFLHCKNLVMRLFNIINHFEIFTGEIKITPFNVLP